MDFLYFLSLYTFPLWPIIIIGFIVFFARHRKKSGQSSIDKEWYLQFALSKEDAVSHFFLLLSIFFLGVTLLAFNREFGNPFSLLSILFITSVLGLVSAYYLKVLYSLLFGLISITTWWMMQAAEWMQDKNIKTSAIFVGLAFIALLFYSLGHLHESETKWKRFAFVYSILGILSITGILFFFSTKLGLSVLGNMTKGVSFYDSWQITLSLFIFLAGLAGAAIYTATKKLISPFEFIAILTLTLLFSVIALLPQQTIFIHAGRSFYYGNGGLSNSGVLWAIIFNLTVFFELLGLIISGYLRRETWLINLGTFSLFFLISVKYFDWFFTFLDKSIFFIGAGILLFIVGWFLEKGRRVMLSNIKVRARQIQQ